ncbi:uncharacterized protein BXZ73DRAFT_102110 [Epithele typhae]|uniref:uncharacterized protein n=1 Tax=Epithele typhae TaxID=378194 RepID=UPI0020085EA2|nr:uncharacterized protein BXZ73DRAFT_102110 [Epithele typhae]KAH9929582.1 hypothetical protein BXZ73DRAFT_102110 [Epithele typhae]
MSSPPSIAALTSDYDTFIAARRWGTASVIVVAWEHIITSGREFRLFCLGVRLLELRTDFQPMSSTLFPSPGLQSFGSSDPSLARYAIPLLGRLYRERRHSLKTDGGATLAEVLLRDGTVYFIALMLFNLLHLLLTLYSKGSSPLKSVSYVTGFTDPVTAILITRFLFHLQAAAQGTTRSKTGSHIFTSIAFERVAGSLGASLDADGDDDEVAEELPVVVPE